MQTLIVEEDAIGSLPIFHYAKPLGKGEIRVLEIHPRPRNPPGIRGRPIYCTLSRQSLDDATVPYKALSYVWGSATQIRKLCVNGKRFQVTQNLYEALLYLRSGRNVLRFWVDQICINQHELHEKNTQVRQMGSVYASAEETRAWLGSPSLGLKYALDILCTFRLVEHATLHAYYKSFRDWVHWNAAFAREILCKEWFSRLWVYQEVLLSKDCRVQYGYSSCPIRAITTVCDMWKEEVGVKGIVKYLYDEANSATERLEANLANLAACRPLRSKAGSSLLGEMNFCRSRHCKDPHDHVYGVYGLCSLFGDGQYSGLDIDYGEELSLTFARATKHGLLRAPEGEIDCLTRAHCSSRLDISRGAVAGASWHSALPSWVPNWSRPQNVVAFDPFLYSAGAGRREKVPKLSSARFTLEVSAWHFPEDRQLRLEGVQVCEVTGKETFDIALDADEVLAQLYCLEERIGRAEGPPHCGSLERWEALARTATADVKDAGLEQQPLRWKDNDYRLKWRPQQLKSCVKGESDNNSPSAHDNNTEVETEVENILALLKSSLRRLPGRAILFTSNGHLALGPFDAGPGDLLVIFAGVQMPWALRPRPGSTTYEMIGPAYLDGFMDDLEMFEWLKVDGGPRWYGGLGHLPSETEGECETEEFVRELLESLGNDGYPTRAWSYRPFPKHGRELRGFVMD